MLDAFPEGVIVDPGFQFFLLAISGAIAFLAGYFIPKMIQPAIAIAVSEKAGDTYSKIVDPYRSLIGIVIALGITDISWLIIPSPNDLWFEIVEIPLSLTLAIAATWLASRLFSNFFDVYLLDAALRKGRKTNSELLILGKYIANAAFIFVAIVIFAQAHQINILGILASLGIGGLAVAFAAQKTLEQLLGGIVLYVDRPFSVDDYIGLPDGTFGRIESIGLRSTKIRSSGKGTLIIVPNSSLTQVTIENFTGAKKVMAILYLNLHQVIPSEERALIRQTIVNSTDDIFGIDSRNTDVAFRDRKNGGENITQVQITFFILGSGDVSMDLRRQLLDLATQSITQQLRGYGIEFDIEESTIYVDSPITI
ncbi:mechanosensitive ion channel family protein [Oxynema aestuarii]|jgi:MscS family membrane protein|uniref:Mechanosensitive ion channel n=1 Tax=Oxynema aestuarii AP17 TaxID=2064643 RepID=A0A6H1TZ45_9CYAN|nr:mechanosensitive ion channel domain-containing protein [Oxynema aestuarii]QIZ71851.1 mechanosensitive ion channel [Oxynema aestuarii AP17]RMH76685.1 MAG: hypothetical protein D6680_07590 [Cyanobacteria bacterium J007]